MQIDYNDPWAVQQAQAQQSLQQAQQNKQYKPQQGQMIGRVYVGSHPLQGLAEVLRNYKAANQEEEAMQQLQGIGQQRQQESNRVSDAMIQAVRGTPANAPSPDYEGNAVGPTMPARQGSMMDAYKVASSSSLPEYQKFGREAMMKTAQSQIQREQDAQIWKTAGGNARKAVELGMDVDKAKTYSEIGGNMAKDLLVMNDAGQLVPNVPLIEARKSISKAGAPVVINEGQKGLDNTLKLRGDFRSEPIYKANQEMQSAYSQIGAGLKAGTPVGDMAAATKIMKLLDPGSVVRESELGMAMAATGLQDRLQNYAQNIISGNKLTPTQRKDFQTLADSLYQESVNQYNAKRKEYTDIAEKNKLDVGHVAGPALSVVRKPNLGGQDLLNQADAILNMGQPK